MARSSTRTGFGQAALVAGIDAYVASEEIGIPAASTYQYNTDPIAQRAALASVGHATTAYRSDAAEHGHA